MANLEKKMVRLSNGLDIAYTEAINGDQPVVWIHGMGSYRETWYPVLMRPPVRGHHWALDLPGFGHSSHWPRRQVLADYADAVVQFLQAHRLVGAVLVGHSFGGMVAGETLDRFPEHARGAIFIGSAGWVDPVNALTPTRFFWINRVGVWVTGMEFFGRRMLKALGVDPSALTRDDRRRLRQGWRRAYEMARMGPFYHSPNFADRVFAARRRTAVIHGDRDILFPIERVRTTIDGRAPLWVIEGSGHLPFYSHPAAFRDAFVQAYRHVVADPHSGSR